jgi:hypothetical protein
MGRRENDHVFQFFPHGLVHEPLKIIYKLAGSIH